MAFATTASRRKNVVSVPGTPLGVKLDCLTLEAREVPAASLVDRNFTPADTGNAASVVLGTSTDGRYAIFESGATDLIRGQVDVPGTIDLFWTDTFTREIQLVTRMPIARTDAVTKARSYDYDTLFSFSSKLSTTRMFDEAVISGDGKTVAFTSRINASFVTEEFIDRPEADRGNSTLDVFRWVSQGTNTGAVTEDAGEITIASRTHRFIPQNANVTVANQKNQAVGLSTDSTNPSISNDGFAVAFVSIRDAATVLPIGPVDNSLGDPNNIVARTFTIDNSSSKDIFLTDFLATDGADAKSNVRTTVVSKYIAQTVGWTRTVTSNNTTTSTVTFYDYYRTFGAGAIASGKIFDQIARSSEQFSVNVDPFGRYMAGDGSTFVFTSNLNANYINSYDAKRPRFAANGIGNNNVYRLQVQTGNAFNNAFGTEIVTTTNEPIDPITTITPTTASGGGNAQNAIVARDDADAVLFTTTVGNNAVNQLINGVTTGNQELYFRRMPQSPDQPPLLISSLVGGFNQPAASGILVPLPNDASTVDPLSYSIAPNATTVAFATRARLDSKLDNNSVGDIYLYNLTTRTQQLISVDPTGKNTGGTKATEAAYPQVSSDGSVVLFESADTRFVSNTETVDTNGVTDVFVRDTATNRTAAFSVTANRANTGNGQSGGALGVDSARPTFHALIGGDSKSGRVYFTSTAKNLDPGFPITTDNPTVIYFQPIPIVPPTGGTLPNKSLRVGAASGGRISAASFVSFDGTSQTVFGNKASPFPNFTGELRVAVGFINRTPATSAQPDMVIATGPGISNRVVVIDGITGATTKSFSPFEANFTGGLNVTAADFDGDGFDDYAIGADENGGPRVKVINGQTGATISDFFAFETSFRGGVRLGSGFVGKFDTATAQPVATDDGVPDLIIGAGIGGGPRVRVVDGVELRSNRATNLVDYFAFELSLRNGVYVSAGDFTRDGLDEVVVGGGPGGGPRVSAFEAKSLIFNPTIADVPINFFAFEDSSRSGVRVAVKNINGDNIPDLLVGQGAPGIARIRTYSGPVVVDNSSTLATFGSVEPLLIDDDVVYEDRGTLNGAWVG